MAFRKWYSDRKRERNQDNTTLSDIIRGIQFCVNSATDIVEQHYLDITQRYFDEFGKPVLKRYYVNDKCAVDIPIFAMSTHTALGIEQMTVRMAVEVNAAEVKSTVIPTSGKGEELLNLSRSSFNVSLSAPDKQKSTKMDIEIVFKAGDAPEAVNRMIDQLNNSVAVKIIDRE